MSKKNKKIKVVVVVGARPNFVKIAPLIDELNKLKNLITYKFIHTGQHYDFKMSGSFFKDLNIPKPNYNLEVGSSSHGWQTGKIMIEFEKVCLKEKPDLVIVVGDVNSTLAGALVAAKLQIPVAHIEAGLRSFDRTMPEEINRLLTDQIADYLFVSDPAGIKNLVREGIPRKKIFYVGNIMIDTLLKHKSEILNPSFDSRSGCPEPVAPRIPRGDPELVEGVEWAKSEINPKFKILNKLKLKKKGYAVLTLHRPSNVDNKKTLKNLLEVFKIISQKIPIVFPVHPRTERVLKNLPTYKLSNLKLIAPLGYLEMLCLMVNSKFVITDSGGIAEETTVLGIPCLTLRKNTERPITVEVGTNIIVGTNRNKILKEVNKILAGRGKSGKIPKFWDGYTAKRIVKILLVKLAK